MLRRITTCVLIAASFLLASLPVLALDGGPLLVNPRNGWKAFEVITIGNDPAGDGFTWAIPSSFDGIGARLSNSTTLQVLANHETSDAAITEINLNLPNFKLAISNMIAGGTTGGGSFVSSSRLAYDRWSSNGGSSWTPTSSLADTSFNRFCSGQSYLPNTFGAGRGFVDNVYITGEEGGTNRLFALDMQSRDLYQLSGTVGSSPGGIGGLPFDSWENAALLDTGETNRVALLLSPDGNTNTLQLYIGEKGKNASGAVDTSSFLARNGLAFGSTYYLNGTLPVSGTAAGGTFDTTLAGALTSAKLEDVDTSPVNPTQAVLGVQETGLFTLNFSLDFSSGSFAAGSSSFSVTRIQNQVNDTDGAFGDADNVDWTAATTLGSNSYPLGLIYVNEDSGTNNGETWMMRPDGTGLTLIADTIGITDATETSGILDISNLLGYLPGSVLLISNQGNTSSMSVLINPLAAPVPEPSSFVAFGLGGGLLLLCLRHRFTSRSIQGAN